MELLERSAQLVLLDERLATVCASGRGRLVLVAGEAGAGKTALVRAMYTRHRGVPVLEGACEALFTPRPLGPFLDIAADAGGELAALAGQAPSPADVVAALSGALRSPHLVVLEDLHWADEATLDVVRMLGRRVARLPVLLVVTYRDEQLDRLHRLRVVLGELPRDAVDRLLVGPLSATAVHELAAARGVDGEQLYERTGGNAFFVTEVLAAVGAAGTPATVRDAVLARAARLGTDARTLLEAVAVVPPRAELWLLERLAPAELPALESCLASGILRAEASSVGFRHEIARVTIENELPPDRRVALHRAALAALAGRAEPARLAHHAEAAADGAAVLEHAAAAGERAARLGAHREAAAHFENALRHADALSPAERGVLLERLAIECHLTLRVQDAAKAYVQARDAFRAAGDRRREGEVERGLSGVAWSVGDAAAAEDHAFKAVHLLEALPEGRELAMAYSTVAALRMLAFECEDAIEWGERALALGERLGDAEIVVDALNNIGAAQLRSGRTGGREIVERGIALALDAGLKEHVARGYANLSAALLYARECRSADRYLDAAIAYAREHELDVFSLFVTSLKARSELDQGRWETAAELAESVVAHPPSDVLAKTISLVVIGLLRARRGDPDPWGPLDEAVELARSSGELLRLRVAAARAEARWLSGSPGGVAEEADPALERAVSHRDVWMAGELCVWRRRAGLAQETTAAVAAPFAAELRGDSREAAGMWSDLGCPYEAALALGASDDGPAMREGLAVLQALGARAAATLVARRLRERGALDVARGPRPRTRANPAGLTSRQLEVLALVMQGERNAEIAAKLFLSEKTVGHHVSAILSKLGVATRGHAAAEAIRLGIAEL